MTRKISGIPWIAAGLLLLNSLAAQAASRAFDIPAGPAAQGMTRFAQQAGVPVLFPYDLLKERSTQALKGSYDPDEALQRLLRGTGLVSYINNRGQIAIRLAEPAAPDDDATRPPPPLPYEPVDVLPEVAVTGSHIRRDALTTPTPVATLTSIDLETLGLTPLVDALVQLPHFLNNDTPLTQSHGTSGAAGASHLNLRGVGSTRTLTLLDGRRLVPSSRFGTVDIALLPEHLLRRVEVVTGGASAAYGSDAVSGVVNLLLDSTFQGMRTHLRTGISERGDNENSNVGFTYGSTIGQQSNLVVSAEMFRSEGVRGYNSRDWFDGSAAIANPDPAGPREVIVPDARATGYTYGGLITSGPLAGTQFLGNGVTAPFERGAYYTGASQSGGDGENLAGDLVWLMPDQRRVNAFARLTTQPTARTSSFLQVLAARTEYAFEKDPPSLWGAWEATIFRENPFLPTQIRERMEALGLNSFRMGRVAGNGELGRSAAQLDGELLTITTGGTWHLDNWSLDGHYQIGRSQSSLSYQEVVRLDRIYRGIDSVIDPSSGEIVCRSTLSFPDDGCVPVNLFGQGSVSPEARAWVTEGWTSQEQNIRQQVAEIAIHGDVPLLEAGRVSLAAGTTWRLDSARSRVRRYPESLEGLRVEPAATQGYRGLPAAYSDTANIFERTLNVNVAGHFSVWEAFGEALVPLLRNAPMARSVDLHAALRVAHYGGSGSIPAWKIGMDWQPFRSLRLRATRSRDVRAGSLSERFDFAASGLTIIDRVVAGEPAYAVIAERQGNPNVEPERSDTTTFGFVASPYAAPGFSLSADYYDIHLRDVIALYGAQNIIDGCAEGQDSLCALIERSDLGFISRVSNRTLNIAAARARGVDLELSWRTPVQWLGGGESLALRLFANRALESSTTNATGNSIDRAGQTGLFGGAPRLQANMSVVYDRAPLRFTVQQRYISSGSYDATYGPADINDRSVRSASYTNFRMDWRPAAVPGATFTFNVQNLLDENPPNSPDWGFAGSLPTNEGLFDVVGRRYVLGVRFEL